MLPYILMKGMAPVVPGLDSSYVSWKGAIETYPLLF